MARTRNGRWRQHNRWDSKDSWQQYREPEVSYGWLKRTVVAGVIFALVYGTYASGTSVGRAVADGVRYILVTETDVPYLVDKLASYAPKNMDVSVLKRIPLTITKPADPLQYMVWPVEGRLIAPFGWQVHPVLKQEMMHEGIDLAVPLGTAVRAAAAGTAKTVNDSAQFGKVLIIEHSQELNSVYGHLGEVLVKPGEAISQGQIVARVGKTGMTNEPMLYFEVRDKGVAIDPLPRIKGEAANKEGK